MLQPRSACISSPTQPADAAGCSITPRTRRCSTASHASRRETLTALLSTGGLFCLQPSAPAAAAAPPAAPPKPFCAVVDNVPMWAFNTPWQVRSTSMLLAHPRQQPWQLPMTLKGFLAMLWYMCTLQCTTAQWAGLKQNCTLHTVTTKLHLLNLARCLKAVQPPLHVHEATVGHISSWYSYIQQEDLVSFAGGKTWYRWVNYVPPEAGGLGGLLTSWQRRYSPAAPDKVSELACIGAGVDLTRQHSPTGPVHTLEVQQCSWWWPKVHAPFPLQAPGNIR